jgi:hypothetical protein
MNQQLDGMKKSIFPVWVVVLLQGPALAADWPAWRGSLGDGTVNDPEWHLEEFLPLAKIIHSGNRPLQGRRNSRNEIPRLTHPYRPAAMKRLPRPED